MGSYGIDRTLRRCVSESRIKVGRVINTLTNTNAKTNGLNDVSVEDVIDAAYAAQSAESLLSV